MTTDVEGEFQLIEKPSTQERYGMPLAPVESTRVANQRSKARLNFALSELANIGAAKFMNWLDQVAERSPAEAAKLYMEMLEFSQPRLKAANVVVGIGGNTPVGGAAGNLRNLSVAELEELARGDG